MTQNFLLIWAGEGYPRDVDAALSKAQGSAWPMVVTARRLSPGAREKLDRDRVNWVDDAGDAHIEEPPAFMIFRQGMKQALARPPADFRWTSSTGAVAETLLVECSRQQPTDGSETERMGFRVPRLTGIAEEVQWSLPQVSKSMQGFDRNGWTSKTGSERGPNAGRNLTDPGAMLSSWASWYKKRPLKHTGAHVSSRDPWDFITDHLNRVLGDRQWAVSDWLALSQVSPFASDVPSLRCYLDPKDYDHSLFRIMSSLDLRPVTSGARVTFVRAEKHVLTQSSQGTPAPTVSAIRLYGDLLRHGVRGSDAAEHLRESEIGF